jgi:hypothetical protein
MIIGIMPGGTRDAQGNAVPPAITDRKPPILPWRHQFPHQPGGDFRLFKRCQMR